MGLSSSGDFGGEWEASDTLLYEMSSSNSLARIVSIFDLFSQDQAIWTVDEIAYELRCSKPTVYRYIKALSSAGFLAPRTAGAYGLGARIAELDRHMRLNDPRLRRVDEVMDQLIHKVPGNLMVCGYYGTHVVCIAQAWSDRTVFSSYDRGRPMPLLRGAAGKVILAYLPAYRLRVLMQSAGREIAAAGLGDDLPSFRQSLRRMRQQGYAYSNGEVDPGTAGVAAPLRDEDGRVLGSLVVVFPEHKVSADRIPALGRQMMQAARAMVTEDLGPRPSIRISEGYKKI